MILALLFRAFVAEAFVIPTGSMAPTLLAGDRSLVDVVAHELAHSWTGNLVSNATAEHFWLNEGFTVFAERRILEELDTFQRAFAAPKWLRPRRRGNISNGVKKEG